MSSQQCKVFVPPPVGMPRGAYGAVVVISAIGLLLAFVQRAVGAGWRWLRSGSGSTDRPRSAAELVALARSVEPESPALAAELRGFALHRGASE